VDQTMAVGQRREKYGQYSTLLKELRLPSSTTQGFPEPSTMSSCKEKKGTIKKKDTWYRRSLRPSLKLSITLRHLACGDSYRSLSYNFRVVPNTIFRIIYGICDAIKAEFAAEVIQCPTSKEKWSSIAKKRWQFPQCALEGKLVAITCLWNTGSMYRNY